MDAAAALGHMALWTPWSSGSPGTGRESRPEMPMNPLGERNFLLRRLPAPNAGEPESQGGLEGHAHHARARRAGENAAGPKIADQLALPGLGPELDDGFRFTWWNTREGVAVWIEHRGRWCAGVVIGLGRKRAAVAIEAASFRRLIVVKPYKKLRRRRDDAR